MPVKLAPKDELAPFLQFLESDEIVPMSAGGAKFVRGTSFADGRMEYVHGIRNTTFVAGCCRIFACLRCTC
jgi:hypothetical protein